MAEFGAEWIYGDLPSEEKTNKVTVEMLDFSWIEQCNDVDALKAIVVRLSTGEEKLTAVAKKCLLDILPDDVKRRRLAVGKQPSEDEKARAAQELLAFQTEFGSSDVEHLEKQNQSTLPRPPPPVRGSVSQKKGTSILKQEELLPRSEEKKSSQAISGYNYEGWERLDTDAMEKAVEKDEEEIRALQTDGLISLSLDNKEAVRRRKELQQLQERLGVKAYSPMERRSLTVHEACKAKECHKAKEYEQALYHYERAIALDFGDQNSAALHHSRAATYVALNSLQAAENDMDTSLYYCDTNPDLWMRRAVIRAKRGQHDKAIKDLDEVLLLDPKNEAAVALWRKCLELHRQQEGERLGLKEVSSKKLHLDNRESSSSKSHRHENVTNTNLLEKEDTQSQHVKGVQRIEKRVSFHNESESGDFVPDDVIKYEDNKLVRASNIDLACTKFRRNIAGFADGSEPGAFVPADDLNYEEDKRVESLYPDIAKSKYVSSCDVQNLEGSSSSDEISSELERGRGVLEDSSSMTEDNVKSTMKFSNLNNEEETQWKSVAINFDDNSNDSSSD